MYVRDKITEEHHPEEVDLKEFKSFVHSNIEMFFGNLYPGNVGVKKYPEIWMEWFYEWCELRKGEEKEDVRT